MATSMLNKANWCIIKFDWFNIIVASHLMASTFDFTTFLPRVLKATPFFTT